jgi:hypothetical protein
MPSEAFLGGTGSAGDDDDDDDEGAGYDEARGIAVDRTGHAYVGGITASRDFPNLTPLQLVYGGAPAMPS